MIFKWHLDITLPNYFMPTPRSPYISDNVSNLGWDSVYYSFKGLNVCKLGENAWRTRGGTSEEQHAVFEFASEYRKIHYYTMIR